MHKNFQDTYVSTIRLHQEFTFILKLHQKVGIQLYFSSNSFKCSQTNGLFLNEITKHGEMLLNTY